MTLTTYYLKKVKNSTKQPTDSDIAATYSNCFLKDGTSIVDPVFTLNEGSTVLPLGRYVKAQYDTGLSYYYWIDTFVSVATGIWELHCSMDTLATWKEDIGNTTAYIERCADSPYAGNIDDSYILKTSNQILTRKSFNNPIAVGIGGYFIVALNGSDQSTVSRYGNDLIAFKDGASLTSFLRELYNLGDNTSFINSIAAIIGKSSGLSNVLSGIYYIPLTNDSVFTLLSTITYFGYTFNQKAYQIRGIPITGTVDISFNTNNLPILRVEPYTAYSIYLPFIGDITIPSTIALNSPSVTYYFDCMSGDIVYNINYTGGIYKSFVTCIAVQCKFDVVTNNELYDKVNYWVNGINAAVRRDVNGAFNTLTTLQDNTTHSYSSGSKPYYEVVYCEHNYIATTQTYNALNQPSEYRTIIGLPYYQVEEIKKHKGFIKCINAHVYGTGLDVRDTIDKYLNEGFFYE